MVDDYYIYTWTFFLLLLLLLLVFGFRFLFLFYLTCTVVLIKCLLWPRYFFIYVIYSFIFFSMKRKLTVSFLCNKLHWYEFEKQFKINIRLNIKKSMKYESVQINRKRKITLRIYNVIERTNWDLLFRIYK